MHGYTFSLRGLALLLAFCGGQSLSAGTVDADAVVAYIESCRKPNGAFGPADQEYTDAAWNYPAVAALAVLNQKIPHPEHVLSHGLGFPAGHVGCGHWHFFHHHQLRHLLGGRITPLNPKVRLIHQGYEVRYYGSPFGTDADAFFKAEAGATPTPSDLGAETLGWYNLASLYYLLAGLEASGRQPAERDPLIAHIYRCQAPSCGFVDLRTAAGTPRDEEAHIASTFFAVASLKLLDAEVPHADRCAAFVRSCQHAGGGFGYHPNLQASGNTPDLYYTWAALRTLHLLTGMRTENETCLRWINGLQNADGGFGDRPTWRSRLYSTYYAVDALRLLSADVRRAIHVKQREVPNAELIRGDGLGIYQALFKMPVCEAKDLEALQQRGLNLLAVKSDHFEIAERLRENIRARQLSLDTILCHEAYPHRLLHSGGLVQNHVGNFTLDSRWNAAQRTAWQEADSKGRQTLPWHEYLLHVLRPMRAINALCYPEQDFEMELALIAYDASLHGGQGYNAILAGFNWAPRDFVRVFPWRERYVERLTPIADCDAHGDLAKWSPQLDHVRNVFIARGPTYADFLEAAAAGRVVCVIAQPQGVASGVSLYGPQPAVDYVRQRIDQWRWWPTP